MKFMIAILMMLWSFGDYALTPAQQQTLASAIRADADQAVVDALQAGNIGLLTNLYNGPSTFVVWRTSVTQDEIMQNGFDWTRVDNLGTGPARVWEWMFSNEARAINPSRPNVRAGIEAVWKGTAADLAVRAAVYVHCKRFASRVEALFATGVGTTANPGLLVWEGSINSVDITDALRDY